ncbi:rRNA pseudouridine synthase [Alphaproteobacteria bacterium]|nr:rRNA pseudouridine synthase [Alphaproteobacteria bacterium]
MITFLKSLSMPVDKPLNRIAKVIARAGICSRREAETYISEGRVSVNGSRINSPALNVSDSDEILIDGEPLSPKERPRLWKYYKAKGLICTQKDPQNRTTVFENIKMQDPTLPRLLSVGRLDYNSEGLLLLTNCGPLARYLELPSTGWTRRYKVRVFGKPSEKILTSLEKGIKIDGIYYGSIKASLEKNQKSAANTWINISLKEGKNQEIRKVMKHLGYTVNRLIRLSYGAFQLGDFKEQQIEEIPEKFLKEQFGKNWESF